MSEMSDLCYLKPRMTGSMLTAIVYSDATQEAPLMLC